MNPINHHHQRIKIISIILAVLCVAVLPLWLFGVPGIDGDYAKGWKKGLEAIIRFPLLSLAIFVVSFIIKKILKNKPSQIEFIQSILLLILLFWFVVNLFFAFRLM